VDFAEDRKMSMNRMIGIGLVVLLHVFLVYALVSGLASSAIDVIKKPLEIKIIQAPPPPPPPPEIIKPPPPPAMVTPPPPYIPPPLIQLQQPPPPPPIAVVTTVKPVAPTKVTPPAPPGPAPPSTAVGEVCPNIGSVGGQLEDSFQQIADNEGLSESHVTVEFSVSPAGVISGAHIVSSDASSLNSLALQGVMNDLRCNGQSQTVNVLAPFDFVPN